MASKGAVGIDLDVGRVPLREADMEPFEIMVSESQERMLCVVEPAQVDAVLAVCARWEVGGTVIGEVTDTRAMRVLRDGELVGEVAVAALVDDCPLYDLAPEPPPAPVYGAPPRTLETEDPPEVLLALLRSVNVASRRPLFEQYDALVGARTVRRPGDADAAVLALPTGGAIALSIDGNGRRVACDPYHGALEAVLECAANLACVGATPLGLTNCLNFGNPERPHVAWQLVEAVRGLADGCRALGVPVVGGNVSLYNETADGPIYPTPVVGMVGELGDPAAAGRLGWARAGDAIGIVGPFAPDLHGSELAKIGGGELPRRLPDVDVDAGAGRDRRSRRRRARRAAGQRARHRRGRARRGARRVLPRGATSARTSRSAATPARCSSSSGRVTGGSSSAAPRDEVARLGTVIGTVGGEALAFRGGGADFALALPVLREAHGALALLFP